uniref:Uncharacterized protein n=1 Tax=Tetranychus urticae TaxID=32264 RepID=T1KNT0_TETUR
MPPEMKRLSEDVNATKRLAKS